LPLRQAGVRLRRQATINDARMIDMSKATELKSGFYIAAAKGTDAATVAAFLLFDGLSKYMRPAGAYAVVETCMSRSALAHEDQQEILRFMREIRVTD
jgi:hypothetical protein